MAVGGAVLHEIRVVNFRSARNVVVRPGPVSALIGEPGAGKSNVLLAVRALLDPSFRLLPNDMTTGARDLSISATLDDGRTVSLTKRDGAPPVLYFPVSLRGSTLVAGRADRRTSGIRSLVRGALERAPAPRVALVHALEACAEVARGVVFAIEEPELFLAPHGHRYLYRLVRRIAARGNQIFYTTHVPGLVNVAALEEVSLVTRDGDGVTAVERLRPVHVDDTFRAVSEFDAERAELFFARAAILVEGMTEKVALPLVFAALGYNADREQISVVECGGKSNLVLFVEICKRARIPYVVVHDSDVREGREPFEAERLNRLIRRRAGARRTVVLEPDFEGVTGVRGKGHKPERAWRRLVQASAADVPEPLVRAVELALASARPGAPTYS